MSKFSFEKGQKTGLIEDGNPQKEEILKIVVKKLIKKHLKGGVTPDQLDRAFNKASSGDPRAMLIYQQMLELYQTGKITTGKITTGLPSIIEKKIPIIDIIEDKDKEEIKELKSQEEKLIELKLSIPVKVPEITVEKLKKDIKDSKFELNEKRYQLYKIIDDLMERDYKKEYVINDDERTELDHQAYLLKNQIEIIKDQLEVDQKKLEKLKRKNENIYNISSNIDKELYSIQSKLKSKDETKRKLEEKAESKRKNTEESINQAKLQLKQKSLFPNIQKLRYEKDQQDKIKNKKKKLKK